MHNSAPSRLPQLTTIGPREQSTLFLRLLPPLSQLHSSPQDNAIWQAASARLVLALSIGPEAEATSPHTHPATGIAHSSSTRIVSCSSTLLVSCRSVCLCRSLPRNLTHAPLASNTLQPAASSTTYAPRPSLLSRGTAIVELSSPLQRSFQLSIAASVDSS